ncbi:MAG: hypothetical protein QM767_07735 [Anaeromyxobacter sp.]
MPAAFDPDRLLQLLRDPHVESQSIATEFGVPREEAGRASRLVMGLARAKPEDLLTLPGPLAAALARAAQNASRADLLVALGGHASKDVAKEAKRALHVLKTRGVAIPESPRAAPPPPPPPAADPALAAYASVVDGTGERAVWLPRGVPGRGVEIAQTVLADERGLVTLQLGFLGRKDWRAFAKEIVERGAAMGVCEVPRELAHAWIAAARRQNEETGQRVPDGADLWLAQLGPAPAVPDPAAAFPALSPEEAGEALARSGTLHDLAMLAGWLADPGYLREVAAKLDEVAVSPLYLDEQQRADQMARVVGDAADAYLTPARRAALSRRLFGVAEHLRLRGDAAHAGVAAATARALGEGAPARDLPFARLLVERAFPRQPSVPPRPAAGTSQASPLILPR